MEEKTFNTIEELKEFLKSLDNTKNYLIKVEVQDNGRN